MVDIQTLAARVTSLISFPDASIQITQALTQEDFDLTQIARIIEVDPALSVSLLKAGNSAAHNTGIPIDTVQKAVTRLGLTKVRQLVLAIEASRSFDALPNQLWDLNDFWEHSLTCGCYASELAKRFGAGSPEIAFTAGLLHDIGELILFSQAPNEARHCIEQSLDSDSPDEGLHEIEKRVFGFTHAEVGAELARLWALPQVLIDSIAFHHDIALYRADSSIPGLVHIANCYAVLHEIESVDYENAPAIDVNIWQTYSLAELDIEKLRASVSLSLEEMKNVFLH